MSYFLSIALAFLFAVKLFAALFPNVRGTQREYSLKPFKHSIVKRVLVFKR